MILIRSLRVALAAVSPLLIARLVGMPEAYWAAITTIIIVLSEAGSELSVSWQRLVGTALGAGTGALLVSCPGPKVLVFGSGLFVLGSVGARLGLERKADRFAGITIAVVRLIPDPRNGLEGGCAPLYRSCRGNRGGVGIHDAWPELREVRKARLHAARFRL